MLSQQERRELFKQLDVLNKEIRVLRAGLNQFNDQKESLFSKKDNVGREISELIRQIKRFKSERNRLTGEVRKAKEERKKLNSETTKKIEEIKKLNKEKTATAKKFGIKEDPLRIKSEIESINTKIETDVIPFNKEKQLMKVLKELKKRYNESKKLSLIWDQAHGLSTEIDALRKKADSIHRSIQQKAQNSQEKHETMLDSSNQIDELRKKEEEFGKKIFEKKLEMEKINKQLEEKLKFLGDFNKKLQVEKKATKKVAEDKKKKRLNERREEVNKKFRKGEKLTTEDILAMQGAEEI